MKELVAECRPECGPIQGAGIRARRQARADHCDTLPAPHIDGLFFPYSARPRVNASSAAGRVLVMTNATINSLLARHSGDPAEMSSMLNAKGFIWRDTEDRWVPGILSLMDYMIEETEPAPTP